MDVKSFTSAKFRSAWIPPDVAHAPIVIRNFEERRTCWIRSASWGVVIEPSTSDTSYGPLTTARDASGKLAISIAPATASNSSSQSRRLNWQPSHDANFQTASFGFGLDFARLVFAFTSHLSFPEDALDAIEAEHRTVLADKMGPVLAVSAESRRAFHVTLH